jgi:peptidylamidoglycolate lyase
MERKEFIKAYHGCYRQGLSSLKICLRKTCGLFTVTATCVTGWIKNWSKADSQKNPVNDCHEMVQDSKGRILLLTNETKNNVLIYNKSGKLLTTWGHDFPGAHGLNFV